MLAYGAHHLQLASEVGLPRPLDYPGAAVSIGCQDGARGVDSAVIHGSALPQSAEVFSLWCLVVQAPRSPTRTPTASPIEQSPRLLRSPVRCALPAITNLDSIGAHVEVVLDKCEHVEK